MIRRPPRSTRTDTRFPYTTLFRSLDLGDADLRGGRHRLVEVTRGLAEDEVAALVGLPPLDDREVGEDAAFEDIILSVEALHFLALGDERADAGLGIEAGDARTARAAAFGERALRAEFDLELARQILPFDLLILADIGDRKSTRLNSRH